MKCKQCGGVGGISQDGGIVLCPYCHCGICGESRGEHGSGGRGCKAFRPALTAKEVAQVRRFIDKELRRPPKSFEWACVNGTSITTLLSIVSGYIQESKYVNIPVLPRQRKRAKELLYEIIAWYERTPWNDLCLKTRRFNEDFERRMQKSKSKGVKTWVR